LVFAISHAHSHRPWKWSWNTADDPPLMLKVIWYNRFLRSLECFLKYI
jgi:hypothetical protein